MDAVISQEALLHVPDKRTALAEAYRGPEEGRPPRVYRLDRAPQARRKRFRIDVARHRGADHPEFRFLRPYAPGHRFRIVSRKDLTAEWGRILEQRFAMYRKLREETIALGTPSGDEEFYRFLRAPGCTGAGAHLGGASRAENSGPRRFVQPL